MGSAMRSGYDSDFHGIGPGDYRTNESGERRQSVEGGLMNKKFFLVASLFLASACFAQNQTASAPLTIIITAATAHSVALTWTASPGCIGPNGIIACPSPLNYHIWRSGTSGGIIGNANVQAGGIILFVANSDSTGTLTLGNYTNIGTTAGVAFTDANVVGGQTWYYVVTAFLPPCPTNPTQACGESSPSNEVKAIIPTTGVKKKHWWKI
jgi:hypothetical protein